MREQGYFIGAIYVNVIATETLLFGALVASLFLWPEAEATVYKTLMPLAIVLPLLFFRHSRSLWLCFDHYFDPMQQRVRLDEFD